MTETNRYPTGSHLNAVWRFCHNCGHKMLIDDLDGRDLSDPVSCPKCKQRMQVKKKPIPMDEFLETK